MKRIAINGFGRMGHAASVKWRATQTSEVVAISNDLTDVETLTHLLKYDSIRWLVPEIEVS